MAIFAAIANGNNTLSTLHMSNNACGNAAARVLGDMLRVNAGLKELDLSWNQIKVRSLEHFLGGFGGGGGAERATQRLAPHLFRVR